jgi:inorganic triphosphatase YgiF
MPAVVEPTEVELKLFLPEGAEQVLPNSPLLRNRQARRQRLDSTYLDTPDRLLQKHGMALRLRRVGRQWLQTLKSTQATRGGLSTRPEWEAPARVVNGKPRVNFARLADTPLPALLARHHAQRKLRPLFRVRVHRTLWGIEFRGSHIEIAMDRGVIEAVCNERRVVAPVAELELELKDGCASDLNAAALRLVGRGQAALALVPMVRGKAERGYLLADGKSAPPAKASAGGFVEALRPDVTVGDALRTITAHGLGVLLANTENLQDLHETEYVHQARVALRRLRSAQRLLDRGHQDFPESLASELRWAARLLGDARDWDVIVGETLPKLLKAAPAQVNFQLAATLDRARAKRDAACVDARTALATARFARLALQLQAWTMTSPPKGRTLERVAPRALDRAQRRLFEAARFFAALSAERRHRVRILAKRLRYALDVLSVALPASETERYIAALSDLQDVLGELNDGEVAARVLDRLGAPAETAAFVREWLAGHSEERAKRAEAQLLALYERARPWD